MASLCMWQNRKKSPNQSTNNGDMDNGLKCYVVCELVCEWECEVVSECVSLYFISYCRHKTIVSCRDNATSYEWQGMFCIPVGCGPLARLWLDLQPGYTDRLLVLDSINLKNKHLAILFIVWSVGIVVLQHIIYRNKPYKM